MAEAAVSEPTTNVAPAVTSEPTTTLVQEVPKQEPVPAPAAVPKPEVPVTVPINATNQSAAAKNKGEWAKILNLHKLELGIGDSSSRNYTSYASNNDTAGGLPETRQYNPVVENKSLSRQSSSGRLLDTNRHSNSGSPVTKPRSEERRFVPPPEQEQERRYVPPPETRQPQFTERQFDRAFENRQFNQQDRQFNERPINENRNFERVNQQPPIKTNPPAAVSQQQQQQQQQRPYPPENTRQFEPSLPARQLDSPPLQQKQNPVRYEPPPQQKYDIETKRVLDNQNNTPVPKPLSRQTSSVESKLSQLNRPLQQDNFAVRPAGVPEEVNRPGVQRPVELHKQQSSANLQFQPPPLQQPSIPQNSNSPPKALFRQFVNRQVIPNRVEPIRSQNVMGIDQSRIIENNKEDPNRLIKLARSEMAEIPRPDIINNPTNNIPPMNNRMEPPRKLPESSIKPQYNEPPKAQPEPSVVANSNLDLSDPNKKSVPPNIMPSGKPVAKAVTITVSGKLPAQKPEEMRRPQPPQQPMPIKKPQDSQPRFDADILKRTDSSFNMDPQRRPIESGGNLGNVPHDERFERMDSSGSLNQDRSRTEGNNINYRKPTGDEFNNDQMRPFARGPDLKNNTEYFNNDSGRNLNDDKFMDSRNRPLDFKRMESNSNFNRTAEPDSMLPSMAYTPDNHTGYQNSDDPNKMYENAPNRPSELNLSGGQSDKKSVGGRVGWKNSDDNNKPPERKISGRSTPTEKGVSFIETPRKKSSDGKVPGTWCALTGRFIPMPFERPKSPDPRPKTPTTPKKKRFVGSYCAKTGRYIPPEKEPGVQTPRTPDKTPSEFKSTNSGRSTPDTLRKGKAMTPREDFHVSFIDEDDVETPESELRKISESGRSTPNYASYIRRTPKKPNIAFGSVVPESISKTKERNKVRRTKSNDWVERRYNRPDGDHDSGVDEATQGHASTNGEVKGGAVQQTRRAPSKIPAHKRASTPGTPGSPAMSPLKSPNRPHPLRSSSLTPEPSAERKKLPMNKIQVGTAASPNLKAVRSKIGSLENTTHKPGGGHVRIENRKIDFSTTAPRIAAKNDTYQPGGGDKKIENKKLQWSAKSKIGSLENTTHKAGGGDKKIESQKLDFKNKAQSKVGSKDNIKHTPGGGVVKKTPSTLKKDSTTSSDQSIENQKLDFKVQSKIGSLANVKHKPGGGDVKIFDDKDYLKQMQGPVGSTGPHSKASSEGQASGTQSPLPTSPPPGMQQNPLSPTAARS